MLFQSLRRYVASEVEGVQKHIVNGTKRVLYWTLVFSFKL